MDEVVNVPKAIAGVFARSRDRRTTDFLISTYRHMTAKQQAVELGMSYAMVIILRRRLYKKGLMLQTRRFYQPLWSEKDAEYLADNCGLVPLEDICMRLGRTRTSLQVKMGRLGINQNSNLYTTHMLAEIFGVNQKTVWSWAHNHYLTGKKALTRKGRLRPRVFTEAQVMHFIQTYPLLIIPSKMTPHYFRSIVLEMWEQNPWYNTVEAAEYVGLSKNGLLWHARQGHLKPTHTGLYGKWFFRRKDLNIFLASRKGVKT